MPKGHRHRHLCVPYRPSQPRHTTTFIRAADLNRDGKTNILAGNKATSDVLVTTTGR